MPDVSLNGIEFEIKGSSDAASDSIDRLTEKLNGLKSSLAGAQSVRKLSSSISSVGDAAKKASTPLNNFLASVKRIAFYRMIRAVIKEITQAIKEGMQTFYDFTKKANPEFANYAKALDGVKAASSQMKNQLGAAFGSLYAAIAPILTSLISLITRFANALTMIFARLGGAGGWYRATEMTADAIEGVGGAAKEALKYLAPFDELNRLPSEHGGGGGGSTGGNGGGYEWVDFEQFDIADGIASIFQWLEDAFNNASEWIENVDWQNLASNIVSEIVYAFSEVDWAGFTSSVAEFIGAALGAVAGFLVGAFRDLVAGINDAIYNAFHNDDGSRKTGEEIWNGICEGIKNAVTGVWTWVKDNIVTPFIDGFKKAFGIASPAKEMIEPGKMVGEGILEGIAAPFKAIGEWIESNIINPIKKWFTDNAEKASITITAVVDRVKNWTTSLLEWITGKSDGKFTGGHAIIDRIKAWAGSGLTFMQWVTGQTNGRFTGGHAIIDRIKSWTGSGVTFMQWVTSQKNGRFTGGHAVIDRLKAWAGSGVKFMQWVTGQEDGKFTGGHAVIDRIKAWAASGVKFMEWVTGQSDGKFTGGHALIDLVRNGWTTVKSWIDNSFLGTAVSKAVDLTVSVLGNTWSTFITAWNALKDKTLSLTVGLSETVKSAWNKAANAWNANSVLSALAKLPTLAGGGILSGSGQIFVARENGPELVGAFGNQTGVMNNQQLIDAVSNGVARTLSGLSFSVTTSQTTGGYAEENNEETMYRAFKRALDETDFGKDIELDGQKLYRAIVRRNRMNTVATGVNAFA